MKSLEKFKDFGVLLVRVAFGFRLIYGVLDNVLYEEHMLLFRDYLEEYGFPFPLIAAYISVYLQLLAGVSFISGLWVRFFSLLMIINFVIALAVVHLEDTYLNSAPAIHMVIISIFLLLYGSGKWGIHFRSPVKVKKEEEPNIFG